MRKIKASFLLLVAAATPLSTVVPAVSVRDAYDYAESSVSVVPENRPTFAVSASNGIVTASVVSGYETVGEIATGESVASIMLALPKGYAVTKADDVRAVFKAGDRTEVRLADVEDGGAEVNIDGRTFTSPAVFPKTGKVTYRVITKAPLPKGTEIITTDVDSKSLKFEIASAPAASAAIGGLNVVSRSDWGADESLRYKDSATWKPYFDKLASQGE